MQITKAEVTPVELKLRHPVRMAGLPTISNIQAVFVRLETRQGQSAWGCTVAHAELTGEKPEDVIRNCQECASLAPDLHATNIEYSLSELALIASASTLCAFDVAFHDLLSQTAGLPLYRILGGYRNRIPTSATSPITPVAESVELANRRASQGFRLLKIKGGVEPEEDVRRVEAIHRALPNHHLRLDADGGYTVQEALDVAHTLADMLEMLEQPTQADNLADLQTVRNQGLIPVLADQSVRGLASSPSWLIRAYEASPQPSSWQPTAWLMG